jgi:hypothetical protein
MAEAIETDPLAIDAEIRSTERRLNNLLGMAADSGDKALLAKIREFEAILAGLREQKAAGAERKTLKENLLAIDETEVRRMLAAAAVKLRGDEDPATGRRRPTSPGLLEFIGYTQNDEFKP